MTMNAALPPNGRHPIFQVPPELRSWRPSLTSSARHRAKAIQKKTTTAVSDRTLPIRTEEIAETARERGRLQKILSTTERSLKSWRLMNHATTYPGQTITGTNANVARSPSTICCAVKFEK